MSTHDEAQHYIQRAMAYEEHLPALLKYLHPSWKQALSGQVIDRILSLFDLLNNEQVARRTSANILNKMRFKCVRTILDRLGMRCPMRTDFEGEQGWLGTLSIEKVTHLFRLRAMAFRRSAIRHCVDRFSRARLLQWLSVSEMDSLMRLPGITQLGVLENAFEMPTFNQLSTEMLEWEGLCLLSRDGVWNLDGPFSHVRLKFPRDQKPYRWIEATAKPGEAVDSRFDPQGSAAVLALCFNK